MKSEYDHMSKQTYDYMVKGRNKWVDDTYVEFKDEADVENWKNVIRRTNECWKEGGGPFLECYM